MISALKQSFPSNNRKYSRTDIEKYSLLIGATVVNMTLAVTSSNVSRSVREEYFESKTKNFTWRGLFRMSGSSFV